MILSGLIWLASYPKSGNTWMRVILGELLFNRERDDPADINELQITDHAGGRALVESVSACPSSELFATETEHLRTCGFRFLAQRRSDICIVKVHDAYRVGGDGTPLFPIDVSAHVIHVVRNPLDVAVSFAAHLGLGLDAIIEIMANDFVLGADSASLSPQLPQHLGSWSDHARSWTDQTDIPVHVVRYEDLLDDAEGELGEIAKALTWTVSSEDISAAVAAASFERLQSSETHAGFREKPASLKGRFFRSGRAGAWKDVLSSGQVERLRARHSDMMFRFGYLGDL